MFSRYAATVKNLRGVLLVEVEHQASRALVEWLVQRFRYRNIGIPPTLFERGREFFEGYKGKPFLELAYPVKTLQKLVELVAEEFRVEEEVAEAVVLASAYVSPIIVLGERPFKKLKPLGVEQVESRVELQDRDWKLHFRIADYTVLDFYQWSLANAQGLWRRADLELLRRERRERIKKDKRRYWRLQKGEKSFPFLLYLDLAQLAVKRLNLLRRLRRLPPEEALAGMGIVAAVIVGVGG